MANLDIELWYQELLKTKSKNTANSYRRGVRKFLDILTKLNIDIESMPKMFVREYISRISPDYAPRSTNVWACSIESYLDYAREKGYQVATQLKPHVPAPDVAVHSFLTAKEINIAINTLINFTDPARTILALALGSGLRVFELASLRLANIIPENNSIFIIVTGKGNKTRKVPLLAFARPFLIHYIQNNQSKLRKWLFPSPTRPSMHVSTRMIAIWCKMLGDQMDKYIHPHSLRHSYATLMHEAGVDNNTLSIVLGHADPKTTAIYTHPGNEMLIDAAKKTESKIWQERMSMEKTKEK